MSAESDCANSEPSTYLSFQLLHLIIPPELFAFAIQADRFEPAFRLAANLMQLERANSAILIKDLDAVTLCLENDTSRLVA